MDATLVDTIIFDFDGTLARAEIDFGLMKRRLLALALEFGIGEEQLQESYVLELLEEIHATLEGQDSNRAERFRARAQEMIQELELEAARGGRMLDGVEEALVSLKSMGYKVGIVTRNCSQAVDIMLESCSLPHDLLLTRDDVPAAKPHPVHLSAAMKKLGTSPERTVLVGDSTIDIAAGVAVGIRFNIGVLTGRYTEEQLKEAGAFCVLKSAADIPKLLCRSSSATGGLNGG